jgi:hypothetical protein
MRTTKSNNPKEANLKETLLMCSKDAEKEAYFHKKRV